MSQTPLNIVILAAGKGTRMYSKMPKVLHEIGGKPMVARVIDVAAELDPQTVCVVIGHGKEQVLEKVKRDVVWVEQTEQLGTGHAVKTALPHLSKEGRTLVLYGDVPLIDTATLQALLDAAGDEVGLLTDIPADPTGLGRIIRNDKAASPPLSKKKTPMPPKKPSAKSTPAFWFCPMPNSKTGSPACPATTPKANTT